MDRAARDKGHHHINIANNATNREEEKGHVNARNSLGCQTMNIPLQEKEMMDGRWMHEAASQKGVASRLLASVAHACVHIRNTLVCAGRSICMHE